MKNFKRNKKVRWRNPEITFILAHNLANTLISGNSTDLSRFFAYYSVGEKCDDCDQYYDECTCEGSRKVSGKPCEDCGMNYCICDFNYSTKEKVREEIYDWINKHLSKLDIHRIKTLICEKLSKIECLKIKQYTLYGIY